MENDQRLYRSEARVILAAAKMLRNWFPLILGMVGDRVEVIDT
jgi:hypothetical protein